MNSNVDGEVVSNFKRYLPYLLIFFVGTTWGMMFSLARMAVDLGASPMGLTFWQAFGGGFTLLVVCLFRRQLPTFNRQYLKHYIVIALAGTAIPGTLFFYAAAHVPAGILAITIALVPMITYIVTWTLGIDAFQARRFVGIFLGFCAILLPSVPDSSLPEPGMTMWVMLCLVASCFYAIEGIYLEIKVPEGTDLVALLSASLFMTAIIMLPIIYVQDAIVTLTYPFGHLEWVLMAIVLVSSSAYAVFLYAVKIAGAVFATMAGYIITISGVFWGILFFQETHSNWVWAALLLMLAGMALVTPRGKLLI